MHKLKFIGKLTRGYLGGFDTILIEQEDGYLISIHARLQELQANYLSSIQVNYTISDQLLTEEEYKMANIISITGGINAEFDKTYITYSSWTTDTDYETIMSVGNHDLYKELIGSISKYIFIEINYTR